MDGFDSGIGWFTIDSWNRWLRETGAGVFNAWNGESSHVMGLKGNNGVNNTTTLKRNGGVKTPR